MAFVAEEVNSAAVDCQQVDTVAHWAVAVAEWEVAEEQHVAVVAEQTVGVAHSAVAHSAAAAALEVVDQRLDTAAHWVAVETVVEEYSAVAAVDLPEYSAAVNH